MMTLRPFVGIESILDSYLGQRCRGQVVVSLNERGLGNKSICLDRKPSSERGPHICALSQFQMSLTKKIKLLEKPSLRRTTSKGVVSSVAHNGGRVFKRCSQCLLSPEQFHETMPCGWEHTNQTATALCQFLL